MLEPCSNIFKDPTKSFQRHLSPNSSNASLPAPPQPINADSTFKEKLNIRTTDSSSQTTPLPILGNFKYPYGDPSEIADTLLKTVDWSILASCSEKALQNLEEIPFSLFFKKLLAAKPNMHHTEQPSMFPVRQHSLGDGHSLLEKSHEHYHIAPPIIQYSTNIYYATEGESYVTVDVLRLGDSSMPCSVDYETLDMSAKAGVKYVPLKGRLTFGKNEIEKDLEVKIINDDAWDSTLDFAMQLSNPSEGTGICESLGLCRIKILDDDAFPSNKYKDLCKRGQFKDIPALHNLIEYWKLNWSYASIRRGARVMLIFDFVANSLVILDLLLKLYIVDHILYTSDIVEKQDESWRTLQLVFVGVAHLFPELLLFVMERFRERLRIGGKARLILQGNIVRKFLNYSHSVRSSVQSSDLIMSITHDCHDVVTNGFFTMMGVVKELCLLWMLISYQLTLALVRSGQAGVGAIPVVFVVMPTLVYPFLMYMFFRSRERKTTLALLRRDFARNCLARTIEKIVHNVRLILDLSQRNAAIAESVGRIEAINAAHVYSDALHAGNEAFAPILTNFVTGLFIIVGGRFVLDGKITLGQFLANVAVYAQFRICWSSIYDQLLKINDALPALEQVSRFLNLPIDLHDRRELSNMARDENTVARASAREVMNTMKANGTNKFAYAVDSIPIRLKNCCFHYQRLNYNMTVHGSLQLECAGVLSPKASTQPKEADSDTQVLECTDILMRSSMEGGAADMEWSLEINQASIVAFVGRHGDAKSTLLRLLGGVVLPTGGMYFVPPQLRTCYVSETPLFFHGTLADNLAFGLTASSKKDPKQIQRMCDICLQLLLPGEIVSALSSAQERDWALILSHAQLAKLNIARAFVANPEFLCFDRPMSSFDLPTQKAVLGMMKQHVQDKGLFCPFENRHLRRPRTVAFTADHAHSCSIADKIFIVRRREVQEIEHHMFHDAALYEMETHHYESTQDP